MSISRNLWRTSSRTFSTGPRLRLAATEEHTDAPEPTEGEIQVLDKLKAKFQDADIAVQDTSGGCGTFYTISVVHDAFKGLSTIKQHRLVNETLADEVKTWHGVQLRLTPKTE